MDISLARWGLSPSLPPSHPPDTRRTLKLLRRRQPNKNNQNTLIAHAHHSRQIACASNGTAVAEGRSADRSFVCSFLFFRCFKAKFTKFLFRGLRAISSHLFSFFLFLSIITPSFVFPSHRRYTHQTCLSNSIHPTSSPSAVCCNCRFLTPWRNRSA